MNSVINNEMKQLFLTKDNVEKFKLKHEELKE